MKLGNGWFRRSGGFGRGLLVGFLFLLLLAGRPLAADEKPICTIAVISNPYITALPAAEIKDVGGKSRDWLKERSVSGLTGAVELVNQLKPDAFVILGNLTWTGSEADFKELQGYLDRIDKAVPVYLTAGPRDLPAEAPERFKGLFKERDVTGGMVKVKGVALKFAAAAPTAAAQLEQLEKELPAAVRDAAGVLLFGGPWAIGSTFPEAARLQELASKNRVAAQVGFGHTHQVTLNGSLPVWTVFSTGWGSGWKLGLIRVYPKTVELSLVRDAGYPWQTLTVPNPVNVPALAPADQDPHRLPFYTEDRALKPEVTFIQFSDSQLDDKSVARYKGRFASDQKMSRAAVEEANRLKADLAFMTGDLTNKNTVQEWQIFNEIYSKLSMPLYTLPGNHDLLRGDEYRADPDKLGDLKDATLANWAYAEQLKAEGYTGRAALYEKFTNNKGRLNYTIEKNGTVFICLNNAAQEITADQLKWLKGELEKSKSARHVFVLGHYPIDPSFGNMVPEEKGAAAARQLLVEYRVAGYLFGHRHGYGYRVIDGIPHIMSQDLAWGESVGYLVYHVFPDRFVVGWKPLVREAFAVPVYERVVFPEPRFKK